MAPRKPVLERLIAVPKVIVGLLLLAVLAALLVTMRPAPATNELTAYFPRTVALYPGSEVRILGVRVGEVESVTPEGDRVKVTMNYERRYDVPADAKAVIISPAIVGDRFVQLTPAYTDGPDAEGRRRPRAGPDRDTGRAGRDLPEPRRPQRRCFGR